jgi:hypothetical protein
VAAGIVHDDLDSSWWRDGVVASARPVPKAPAQIAAATAIEISEIFMAAPSLSGGIARMIGAGAATGIRANRDEPSVLPRSLERRNAPTAVSRN